MQGVNREWNLLSLSVRYGRPLVTGGAASWRNARLGRSASVCLVTWGALYIEGVRAARHELERFAVLQAAALQRTTAPLSLRDRERISAWRRALNEPARPPLDQVM
jgi:hypothetical protein